MEKGCENKLCRRYRRQAGQKILSFVWSYWLRTGLAVSLGKRGGGAFMRVVQNGEDLLMTAYVTYPMRCDLCWFYIIRRSNFFMLGAMAEIEQSAKMDFSYVFKFILRNLLNRSLIKWSSPGLRDFPWFQLYDKHLPLALGPRLRLSMYKCEDIWSHGGVPSLIHNLYTIWYG